MALRLRNVLAVSILALLASSLALLLPGLPSARAQASVAPDIFITLFGERYVYVIWTTNHTENANYEIMFRASNDNGTTFGPAINLSNSTGSDSIDPQIMPRGRNVYVVWWEVVDNRSEPVFVASHDFGKTFGQPLQLMNGTGLAPMTNTANGTDIGADNAALALPDTAIVDGNRNQIITSIPSSNGNFTAFTKSQ